MKQTDIFQTHMTPKEIQSVDQVLLQGLPLRHKRQPKMTCINKDRLGSLSWLRVPLLLLGVIGALGLLAHYKPRFAEVSSVVYWPNWWISVVFLGLAGCVFFLLLIDWIYLTASKFMRSIQQKKNPRRLNWRSQ